MPHRCPAAVALVAMCAVACEKNAPPPASPRLEESPRYNFRFRGPGEPWTRIDPGQIDPGAALAYSRSKPDVSFLLYASRPGEEIGTSRIVDDWKKQLAARATGPVEVNATPLVVNGVSGTRADAVATVQSVKVAYENWIVERRGFSYQLVAWGSARDRAAISREATALFARFEVIDRNARVDPPRRPARPYTSPDLGWSIDLGLPWIEWRSLRERLPAAEYGATCGDASIAIAAVPLLGHRLPLDVAAGPLLSLLDLNPPQNLPRHPVHAGSWAGYEFPYEQKVGGKWMRYRIQALAGEDAALVAAEWRPPDQPDGECAEPFDRLNTGPGRRVRDDALEQKAVAARFFADVARRLRASGRPLDSAEYFAQASVLAPDDSNLLLDEVRVLQQLGRRDEAFRCVAARLHDAPCASAFRVRAAELLAEMGRAPEALATWTSTFACGYRDPDALSRYLQYLEREGRLTLAFREAQAFADPSDLPRLRGQLAAGGDPR
ncbi:MAG TPA: hypothetical protein VG496_07170 [Myxococcales bacterium]|nr:hypothetical protein [Myxococcales bacterium]